MQIKTKYNIGDRIWIVKEMEIYSEQGHKMKQLGELEVFDDYIMAIDVYKDGFIYMLENADMIELYEHDVIPYEDKQALLDKIEKEMKKIHDRDDN